MNKVACRKPSRTVNRPLYFPHFGNIFNEFMQSPFDQVLKETDKYVNRPLANIHEFEDRYEIQLALPGISKSDIDLQIEKDVLTIKGVKSEETEKNYHLREFNYEGFERKFRLSEVADRSSITAEFKNGILHVGIPKLEELKPKSITIK